MLSTLSGMQIEPLQTNSDEPGVALRASGMSQVAVEGILGMTVTQQDGFTPQQTRSVLTITPRNLASLGHHAPTASAVTPAIICEPPSHRAVICHTR